MELDSATHTMETGWGSMRWRLVILVPHEGIFYEAKLHPAG